MRDWEVQCCPLGFIRHLRLRYWYTDLSSLSVFFYSLCLSVHGRGCGMLPNVYLTSRLPCHHTVRMMFALPFWCMCCGFDESETIAVRSAGACRSCVCPCFYPSIHPVPPSHHPSSPGVYVSSTPLHPFVTACPVIIHTGYLMTGEHERQKKCLFVCVCT